jgi:hypothetical protein
MKYKYFDLLGLGIILTNCAFFSLSKVDESGESGEGMQGGVFFRRGISVVVVVLLVNPIYLGTYKPHSQKTPQHDHRTPEHAQPGSYTLQEVLDPQSADGFRGYGRFYRSTKSTPAAVRSPWCPRSSNHIS